MRKIFTFLLALVASVGMSWASVTWISDQYGNHEEKGYNAGTPFTKDGVTVTMSDNAFFNVSYWGDASLQCIKGTFDPTAGNYVFSNSLGENFVKIVIAAGYPSDWESFPKGDGWVLSGDEYNGYILTWTGNASTVTLMDNELHSVNQSIEGDIVFYFESDIPAWVRDGDTWDEDTKTLTVNSNTGDNAYASKTDIKHLIVSDEVTELGWGTFFFDSLMTTVELGNNLEIIGISAFNECRSLSTITVPASVTNIKVRAFQDCRSLTTFICEAVTPPTIGNAIFQNANNLTAIYVPAASVDAYKSAWSDYASLIKAIGGEPEPATNPIVIATNTGQSSYTQGSITVSVGNVGDSDGFRLNDDNPASISNSGSSTISKIELVPGWFLNKHSYVRANGAEPNSSSEELITFLNVNSNEVTLSCSVSIYIKEVRIYFEEEGGEPEPTPTVWTALKVGDVIKLGDKIEVPAEGDGSWGINGNVLRNAWGPYTLIRADIYQASELDDPVVTELEDGAFYVFKAENSDFYPLSYLGKSGGLVVTTTSDGLVVTAAENKEFTVAVHDNGGATAIDEISQGQTCKSQKLIKDGQILIIRDGKTYTVTGQQVR